MYEYFQKLLDKFGVTPYKVAKETGITTATLTNWKKGRSTPKPDKLQKIADYFGVSLTYLLTGKMEENIKKITLIPTDERDIAKDVENIIVKIQSSDYGPAMYNGIELSAQSIELFRYDLEAALERLKMYNKKNLTLTMGDNKMILYDKSEHLEVDNTTYEIIMQLCEENNIAPTALEKKLGFGRGSIGKLKSGNTSATRLQKIANYFNVSLAYLVSGNKIKKEENDVNDSESSLDVAKDIDKLIAQVDLFRKDLIETFDKLREYN